MSNSPNLRDLAQSVQKQPKSIISIIGNGVKIYSLYKEASALKELIGFIATVQTQSSRQINKTFINLSESSKKLLSAQAQEILYSLGFFTWINDQQKKDIISEIEWCQSKLVNSILFKELIYASGLIFIQISSLGKLFKDLTQNVNLEEESRKKLNRIIEQLDELERDQIAMSQTLAAMEEAGEVDQATLRQLSFDLILLSNKEAGVHCSIDQIKKEISNKIICLSDQRNVAFCDTCMNVSQVASNLIEYNMAGEMYSSALIALKLLTTTIFAVVSVVKYQQNQLASKKIKRLSEILRQVETAESQVETIREIILAAIAWTRERT